MSIRNKLILMLAIPLIALALVGAVGFRSQSTEARLAQDALEDDRVVQDLNLAIKAVGAERLAVANGDSGLSLAELRAEAADSLENLRMSAIEADVLGVVDDVVSDAFRTLATTRYDAALNETISNFNEITEGLRDVRDELVVEYPDQATFADSRALDLAVDIADRQDVIWLEYIAQDQITATLAERLQAEITATELLREQIVDIATETHLGPLNASLGSSIDANIENVGRDALDVAELGTPIPSEDILEALTASHNDWYGHAFLLQDDVTSSLGSISDGAESRQNLFALLATLGLLILFGLIYVVYRSVVRPLDELLVGAEEIATETLPAVVEELRTIGSSDDAVQLTALRRDSDDELGSLVDAFNDVQFTAFDLAVEQARSRRNIAEMFVNLGRRNQKLLQRMLGVISDLETDEKDAAKLDQLFQLDHMTTRMRRNAESLLVVAGTTTPRQWSRPVPAADVVRSALAEVADYDRIDILALADAPMAGNAVADVTHLLAELLENALQFSEPDTRVTVSSRWKSGDYRIVISDSGFGLTAEELQQNNSLIANPPSPDEAPTRFLGLFVVGHLAKRHGIDVQLTDATIGGTDARISIPASLMSETSLAEVQTAGLPVRPDEELDLDAELALLTAEADAEALREADEAASATPVVVDPEIIAEEQPLNGSDASSNALVEPDIFTGDLPVRGATPAIDFNEAPELPTFQREALAPTDLVPDEPVLEAPAPEAPTLDAPAPVAEAPALEGLPSRPVASTQEPALRDLPAPPSAQAPAPIAEAPVLDPAPANDMLQDLPVRGQAPSPVFDDPAAMPDLPVRGQPAPVGAAPVAAAAAAVVAAPVAAQAVSDIAVSEADAMGLPTRTPNATLNQVDVPQAAAPVAAETEPEDVAATASSVGSAFSAFQAGVQRGERTPN